MVARREIILGGKGHRRRKLGPWARRIRFVAILVVSVSFVVWAMEWMSLQTRVKQAQLDISRIGHAARLFRADFGRCPVDIEELITPPEGTSYLDKGKDPWGQPYIMICPARYQEDGVDIISRGPDGGRSGADNIKSLYVGITP